MKVSYLPEAEAEHLRQIAYYEGQQVGLGARYLEAVTSALTNILDAPHRCPVARAPEIRRHRVKGFPFTLYFRSTPDSLLVIAVAPNRRRPGYWYGRF
ncbi:MAG: type II toxin-antitoxin system RelE/ParE family toxin [Gammaproteobacteria bacterium HGW-Gammaproteobacteria-7]|nr:MAG: type II toxin-antitoxin system RelE/ParE family toxin [Gammaproteobacteria bacterium HGW-Gammaproteobacteria-7]